jgi:hypothetical protein
MLPDSIITTSFLNQGALLLLLEVSDLWHIKDYAATDVTLQDTMNLCEIMVEFHSINYS